MDNTIQNPATVTGVGSSVKQVINNVVIVNTLLDNASTIEALQYLSINHNASINEGSTYPNILKEHKDARVWLFEVQDLPETHLKEVKNDAGDITHTYMCCKMSGDLFVPIKKQNTGNSILDEFLEIYVAEAQFAVHHKDKQILLQETLITFENKVKEWELKKGVTMEKSMKDLFWNAMAPKNLICVIKRNGYSVKMASVNYETGSNYSSIVAATFNNMTKYVMKPATQNTNNNYTKPSNRAQMPA